MAAPVGNNNHLKHGKRKTRLYNIWRSMRQRCTNSNCVNFHRYGGRGISVCTAWNDFEVFYEWAVKNGYSDNLTIDRINTNGNYEPDNCRWTSQKEQQNNRSNNRILEFQGIKHTLCEWAEITGISVGTIWSRLNRGWNVEDALTIKPVIGHNQFN